MRSRSRQRTLTASEQELWRSVTRFVARLDGGRAKAPEPDASPPAPSPGAAPLATPSSPAPATPKRTTERSPPLAALEVKVRKRLARGRLEVDAKLDLHGLRQAEAHLALRRFLHRAQNEGARVVLIVTGKGAPLIHGWEERGVLRRQLPHWLSALDMRPTVIGFEPAADRHGGEGAFYVRLRSRRARIGRVE